MSAVRPAVIFLVAVVLCLGVGCKNDPVASFTMTPTSGAAPLTVQFTQTTTFEKASIASQSWNFGDGQTSAEQNPTHTYITPGSYQVILTVQANGGRANTSAPSAPIVVNATVPNLAGLTEAAAGSAVTGVGLVCAITRAYSATVPADQVISQYPAAGTVVAPGSTVSFEVSRGSTSGVVLSVDPARKVVPGAGGQTLFSVSNSGTDVMNWSASVMSGASWCRITSGLIGTNAGTVTVECDANFDPDPRTAEISVAANWAVGSPATLTVVQAGADLTIMLPGSVPLTMRYIPAGSFTMGSSESERGRDSNEGPAHSVIIGSDFYVGMTEVTQQQWLAVRGSWPGEPITVPTASDGLGDLYPAYDVSYTDARNFIDSLNTHITATGQGSATMRLPSEAEWEYSCRAGTQTRFFFGDSLGCEDFTEDCEAGVLSGNRSDYMWFLGNNAPVGGAKTVASKIPNMFGLYDMSGNVLEWCEDDYHSNYTGAPLDGGAWVDSPRSMGRVVRGGNWGWSASLNRSATRISTEPTQRLTQWGFRIARTR